MDTLKNPTSEIKAVCAYGPEQAKGRNLSECFSALTSAVEYEIITLNNNGSAASQVRKDFSYSHLNTATNQGVWTYVQCNQYLGTVGAECKDKYGNYYWSNTIEFKAGTDLGTTSVKGCPPSGFPEHIHEILLTPSDPDSKKCAEELKPEECGEGYESKSTSAYLGSPDACLPKKCPSAGTQDEIYNSSSMGGDSFGSTGTYCNQGCAYSVPEVNEGNTSWANVVSVGTACGTAKDKNKKLADLGDEDSCTKTPNADGVDVLSCSKPPTPETPDPTTPPTETKVDDTKTPDKVKADCSPKGEDFGGVICALSKVETEQENTKNNILDNQNELHNKKLDANKANSTAEIEAINQVADMIYLTNGKTDEADIQIIGKLSEILQAVQDGNTGTGTDGGTGGNGDGTGTGEGTCTGADCVEGDVCLGAECLGFTDKLVSEQVDLTSYATQYQNIIPQATLESKKCVTLTTGNQICLDLSNIIAFFQGVKYLLILGAWIHCAAIIRSAV